MRPAGWLTALAVCLVAMPVICPAPALAAAKPAPGLCSMNTSRGAVPASFAIDACVTNSGIWLRNQLQVPVRFKVSGDARKPVNVHTDIGLAAMATRAVYSDPLILLPGDVVRIPVGTGKASATLSGTDAGGFYALAVTVATFLPGATQAGTVVNAFTGLIKDLANATFEYKDCLVGKNWIGQQGCQLARVADVTWAVGKAAVAIGFRTAPVISLVLNAATYLEFLSAQVPGVEAVLSSQRTISLAALPPAQPPPPPQPAPKPPASGSAPGCPDSATFQRLDENPPSIVSWKLIKGPKCAAGWAVAEFEIGRNGPPPGTIAYEWIVLRHASGAWRFAGAAFVGFKDYGGEPFGDDPNGPVYSFSGACSVGPPREITSYFGGCQNPGG